MEEFKVVYEFGKVVCRRPIHNYFKLDMYFEKHSGDDNKVEVMGKEVANQKI